MHVGGGPACDCGGALPPQTAAALAAVPRCAACRHPARRAAGAGGQLRARRVRGPQGDWLRGPRVRRLTGRPGGRAQKGRDPGSRSTVVSR